MAGTSEGAKAAWRTRRQHAVNPRTRARASEQASKVALQDYCKEHGWRVAFFEGPTGAPRTGIIDAVIFRVAKHDADLLDLRLVQLKGGKAGVSGPEIARLKRAATEATVTWLIAAYDGEVLHMVPDPVNF
jgi:hypothetical protein